MASDIPLQPLNFITRALTLEKHPLGTGEKPPEVVYVDVGPRYLETFGLRIVRGSESDQDDGLPGREGVIVNERFVALFSHGEDILGARIKVSGPIALGRPWRHG